MAHGEISMDLRVGPKFAALSGDLRRAGAGGLRRELFKALNRSARPAIDAVRASASSTLPSRGGFAARVAGSSITVRGSTTAGASIRIVAKERSGRSFDAEAVDAGNLRHPVYGRWSRGMKAQSVPPGWFTRPLTEHAPEFRRALEGAVDEIAREIG